MSFQIQLCVIVDHKRKTEEELLELDCIGHQFTQKWKFAENTLTLRLSKIDPK